MTLWFSEISGNEWGITSFSRPDSSSCSQQGHCSCIPPVIFLKVTGRARSEMTSDSGTSSSTAYSKARRIWWPSGHAAKDISDGTDLSGFGWLDSWWIDHLILLRFHFTVNYVRVPQIWDRHLFPFLCIFCWVFFICFVILNWMGLAWVFCWISVKINIVLSITLMLFWYYIEEITGLIHFSFWHAPEKVVVLQTSNFVQKNKKNVAVY